MRIVEVNGFRLSDASLVADIASARDRFGARAAVLVETVLLRRRAAAKFADPSEWLFTDDALQQATAQPVAEHRARRLAGATVHDVTCSVGTELAALRNSAGFVVGSDIDPVRLAMAAPQRRRRATSAAPTRCDPSPVTPSYSSTPPGAAADGAGSTRVTTRRHWMRCWTSTGAAISS